MKAKRLQLTRSARKHIREEKGRIRKANEDPAAQAKRVAELYAKFGVVARA